MSWMLPLVNFETIFFFVIGLVLSIVFHEAGHYLTAGRLGLKPKRNGLFEIETEVKGSKDQRLKVVSNAIMIGFLPIAVVFLLIGFYALLIIPLYLIGCKSDFVGYGKIRREI